MTSAIASKKMGQPHQQRELVAEVLPNDKGSKIVIERKNSAKYLNLILAVIFLPFNILFFLGTVSAFLFSGFNFILLIIMIFVQLVILTISAGITYLILRIWNSVYVKESELMENKLCQVLDGVKTIEAN